MLLVSLLATEAFAACIADACFERGPRTGVSVDGVTLLLDVSFGRSASLSRSGSTPSVLPKAALGLVVGSDLGNVGRYPVLTPYVGLGPASWDAGWATGASRPWALYAGTHVLGFGDVGFGWATHPRTREDLAERASHEPEATRAMCVLVVDNWRGAEEGDETVVHATWQEAWTKADAALREEEEATPWEEAPAEDVWGASEAPVIAPVSEDNPWGSTSGEPVVQVVQALPEPSGAEPMPTVAMPRATADQLRAACMDGHADAVIELVDRYEATYAERPDARAWRPRVDSLVYLAISPATGVRALLRAW